MERKHTSGNCKKVNLAVQDAMDVLNGKWRILIISCLIDGKQKYSDLLRELKGISGKMLSRELRLMETNKLIIRSTAGNGTKTVQYELTDHAYKLKPVILNLADWGFQHRNEMMETNYDFSELHQ